MKFLVTAFWSDGLTNVEDHATLFSAQDFAKEALNCEGIVKVIIEKTHVSVEDNDALWAKAVVRAELDTQ
jgi:hypothetical protein